MQNLRGAAVVLVRELPRPGFADSAQQAQLSGSRGSCNRGNAMRISATRISDETIEAVCQAVSIVEVAGERIRLKRSGKNYFGLCPFHSEKTPSFAVHPVKQIYRCFGCGVGGDVFDFVARIERTDFLGAVRSLASRSGIQVSGVSPQEAERLKREREARKRAVEELVAAERSALAEARDDLHSLLTLRRNGSNRLRAIHAGETPRWADEEELCWEALRFAEDRLREADTAYCIAAFAAEEERRVFALHQEHRAALIRAAIERGYVKDERGFRIEVPR